jgi:hypothetical protein
MVAYEYASKLPRRHAELVEASSVKRVRPREPSFDRLKANVQRHSGWRRTEPDYREHQPAHERPDQPDREAAQQTPPAAHDHVREPARNQPNNNPAEEPRDFDVHDA